ncbi:predicted protein [Sclerotinia sclerotiorum 1980 UF-70]|uniref:Uncharacterized protein n=1 Tax=Sclerotinia sclerotiorum (strain ATCC 18683 / 1980 / Ss-1) TaxID=665079 RepID=A7EXF6_SCLS1|nr:predicted protein [Sclerotinia sclerotiorum 1980 UF-70]EDN94148.1 predicted protein [Sclerotinia sclerotiorum 1980 UF-70]
MQESVKKVGVFGGQSDYIDGLDCFKTSYKTEKARVEVGPGRYGWLYYDRNLSIVELFLIFNVRVDRTLTTYWVHVRQGRGSYCPD